MERPTLDHARLVAALGARWPQVEVVSDTGSTNADLAARAASLPDRTLLAAEHQSAGRGRYDRVWQSPPGAGLTFSVLVRPAVPLARWGWLPLLTGVAVAEAVDGWASLSGTGSTVALKWPNDLLAGGRKLAGILAQTADDSAVIGVGLNVSTTADELPVDTATSLALVGADPDVVADRTGLLVAVAERLDARVAQWDDHQGDAEACGLAAAYRQRCATLGRTVRVTLGGGTTLEGEARTVDADGHLVVVPADGPEQVVPAGDVEHLRPAG
ncbi:biotin--[acetyl-CoA-carboxylase] ligase [Jatrophihabitans fulvus]